MKNQFGRVAFVLLLVSVVLFGCGKSGKDTPGSQGATPIIAPTTTSTPTPTVTSTPTPTATSTPTPTPTPEEKPYEFVYDPYVVAWDYEASYGEEFSELYHDFVTAYLNYETSIDCPGEEQMYWLIDTLRASFLMFSADAYVDYDHCYDAENQQFYWFYKSDSKEEHEEAIAKFEEVVAGYIEPCLKEGDNEIIRAIELYRELSRRMTYDYEALDGRPQDHDVSPYNALVNQTGICQSFAGAYMHLLQQVGIRANFCSGHTYDLSVSHEWCVATLDGKDYYIDPTYENGGTLGEGLRYFGMTTADREVLGDYDPEYFLIGSTNEFYSKEFDISDTRFALFRECDYFHVDREREVIICYSLLNDATWEVSVAMQ